MYMYNILADWYTHNLTLYRNLKSEEGTTSTGTPTSSPPSVNKTTSKTRKGKVLLIRHLAEWRRWENWSHGKPFLTFIGPAGVLEIFFISWTAPQTGFKYPSFLVHADCTMVWWYGLRGYSRHSTYAYTLNSQDSQRRAVGHYLFLCWYVFWIWETGCAYVWWWRQVDSSKIRELPTLYLLCGQFWDNDCLHYKAVLYVFELIISMTEGLRYDKSYK
jgi:hypothetical protein